MKSVHTHMLVCGYISNCLTWAFRREDCENILEVHMELSYKLEKFEGPLDLLLHLIDVNKFNNFDIPIVEITAQYMEYLKAMATED